VPIAITDWNTAVDTGWYRSQSTATNIPQATAGVGMTIAWSTTNILQYFWTTSGIEWRRYYSSSTWQPWERMQWGRDDQDARYGLLTDQTAALALKANIASPSFTGTVTGHSTLMPFSRAGALTVAAGTSRVPMLWPGSFDGVAAMVNTAPTGSSLLVDVNKNGTTIFGTQANRPTIAAGATAATVGANTVTAFAAGDYLTVDVDSVGSTVAGSDLVVTIGLRRTGA
jgi:hypothetical protein